MKNHVDFKKTTIEIKDSNNAQIGNISKEDIPENLEHSSENTSNSLNNDVWYKKPIGLILIGVLITVIGGYIIHKFGF